MKKKEMLKWVQDEVAKIRKNRKDFESAHSLEDDLFRELVAAIAEGDLTGKEVRQCAVAALKSLKIKFQRACA